MNSLRYAVLVFALGLSGAHAARAASAIGTVKLKVISAIAISNVSTLDFGVSSPGDAAKTVAAGEAENAANGSFQVRGEPGASFTISLPGSVSLTNGSTNASVAVNQFTSSPASTGIVGAQGTQMLYVGATRAALPANLASGDYTGSYAVTVVY